MIRTPYSTTHFLPLSLNLPSPSFSDKGKAKEILHGASPPPWYPNLATNDDEEAKLEGSWWGAVGRDEAYMAGLPAVPMMAPLSGARRRKIPRHTTRHLSIPNGDDDRPKTPSLVSPKPISLESVIHRSVDKLCEARRVVGKIQDFQRIEAEGGLLPLPNRDDEDETKEAERKERVERKRKRKAEGVEAKKRRKTGGEVGEPEAVHAMKKTTAGMLAHAGFEGERGGNTT